MREGAEQQCPGSMRRSQARWLQGTELGPNMVIRTQLCPTFSNGLNQSLNDAGQTIYGRRAAAASGSVSLMCLAGMSDAGLQPNVQTKPYS